MVMLLVTYFMVGFCTAVLGFIPKQLVINDNSFPKCGPNEIATTNKTICPPQTCESIYKVSFCVEESPTPGCDCIDNYLRNSSGICVPIEDCPTPPVIFECGLNEVPTTDRIICPPQTCESTYTSYDCEVKPPEPGCDCIDNYLRNASGVCIPSKECPNNAPTSPECGPNEVATDNAIICPPQTCKSLYTSYDCLPNLPVPGCNCIDNYLRNDNGTCIPQDECPPHVYDIKCGANEIKKEEKTVCPPQTCESKYSINFCIPSAPEPGCDCIDGYLRNDFGVCIPSEDCPTYCNDSDYNDDDFDENYDYGPVGVKCGPNEVSSDCKIICPPQTCESIYTSYMCEEVPCEKGCNCIDGYLRDANGTCIFNENCPTSSNNVECGPNEVSSDCKIVCPPQSCASIYTSYSCIDVPCEKGCDCVNGFLRDANGTCITSDECPSGPVSPECGVNEVLSECKRVCPPQSCESLYTEYLCYDGGCESGCNCIDNYFRDANGTCIPSNQCPPHNWNGGTVCGVNETFVDCAFRCPNQFCPNDDSRIEIACKPGRPCPSGCACESGYLRTDDDRCVQASDCPPVPCTRPNEEWDPCASDCLAEKCEDINNKQSTCEPSDCRPKCVCKKNFYRDENDICIPAAKCEGSKKPCYNDCTPTCAEPNPPNCSSKSSNQCETGFVLSEKGGKCIKIDECPQNLGCNGDPNAVLKACPAPCPSTCDSPNSFPCKKKCEPVGCQCVNGYILSALYGKCIQPNDCEGGNPCGENERFVPCKTGCPTDYCPVDDSRGLVICETFPFSPCYSGCICNLNHKRLSRTDDKCIVSSDCPPVTCTRPNEEWNPCPSECLGEYCDSAFSEPVVCNTLLLNCSPRCTCIKDHYRNATDICIPAKQCPRKGKTKC
ncbi:zonadhesin-like [Aphomia sociella]